MNKWEYVRLDVSWESGNIKAVHLNGKMVFEWDNKQKIKFNRSDYLAKLGTDGWELVTVYIEGGHPIAEHYYFKRPLEE